MLVAKTDLSHFLIALNFSGLVEVVCAASDAKLTLSVVAKGEHISLRGQEPREVFTSGYFLYIVAAKVLSSESLGSVDAIHVAIALDKTWAVLAGRRFSEAALAVYVRAPRVDLPILRKDQTVILPRSDLFQLKPLALDLLHEKRCSSEVELAVVEAELAVFVASDGKELSLLGEDQGMGATAGNGPDQDVETETLWDVHVPISIVLGRVLPVTELAVVVTTLREVLSVPIGDLFKIFVVIQIDLIGLENAIFFRNSIIVFGLSHIGVSAVASVAHFKRSGPRIWSVL